MYTSLPGQRFTHRQYKHDWYDHLPVAIDLKPEFADYPAVILYEEVVISLINPTYKRYFRIKFNTQEGIDRFNDFFLPTAVDPYLFRNNYPLEKQDTTHYPLLKEDEINYFDARIIRKDDLDKGILDEVITKHTVFQRNRKFRYFSFRFYIRNLKPGDELEVSYSHKLPAVYRFFFHGMLPKQESIVKVKIPRPYMYGVKMRNFTQAYDSILNKKNKPVYVTYQYSQDDLHPVDHRFSQESYQDLPYIEFYVDKFQDGNSSIFQGSAPTYPLRWRDILYKLANYRADVGYDYEMSKVDGNTQTYNRIFEEIFDSTKDKPVHQRIQYMQEVLSDEYAYEDDWQYYTSGIDDLESVKNNLGNKVLRHRYRHPTYYNFFYRLAEDYYHAFLGDKRVYRLNEKEFHPPLKERLFYAVQSGANTYFVAPKMHRFGYYMNELPFYLTDIKVYLIPQLADEKTFNYYPGKIEYPLAYTPRYESSHNRRITTTIAKVNLQYNTASIQSNLQLSGQFSTMTRGAYLYHYRDSSVNRKYNQLLHQLKGGVLDEQILESIHKSYPFDCTFGLTYHSDSLITQRNDSSYILNLSGWMNFIYPEGFDSTYYHTYFYPDFEGQDNFDIRIDFGQEIKLLNGADYLYIINNEFAYLRSSVSQLNEKSLKMSGEYRIKTETVSPGNIGKVQEVFEALHKLANARLILKKTVD